MALDRVASGTGVTPVARTDPDGREPGARRRSTPATHRLLAAVLGSWLLGLAVSGAQVAGSDGEYQPGTPFTYLFDTGSRSPRPLSRQAIAAKEGWTLVPEDDTEHAFQGDVVLLNDKLTVVLRRQGPGAEVYSQTAGGARLRAVVMSAPMKAVAITGAQSVRIVENSPGAVMVDADFHPRGQSGTCTASFRLTTGQAMLEMTGGQAADRFFVWSSTRYVVVPDFFADDMVFSASACDLPRFGLPTENFLLNMIEGGDAMLMCVWRSAEQEAYAVTTREGGEGAIRGCEIGGGQDKTLWVALLEQPDVWHGHTVSVMDASGLIHLDWSGPFEAKWRADLLPFDGPNESWALRVRDESWEPEDSRVPASWLSEADRTMEAAPDGKHTVLRVPQHPGAVVVYPIDRTRDTPLTVLCPIDVLRNTLGVGPCQYVLQSEGLASDASPTPDQVMDWVERQFASNKEGESSDEIKQRLDAMADHLAHVQARIDQYAALVRELRALCQAGAENTDPAAIGPFVDVLDEMETSLTKLRESTQPVASSAVLAKQIAGLIGKENALAECKRLGEDARRIGTLQDRALSKCRMAVRWLRQQARMTAIRDPGAAELARAIQARTEQFIQGQ